ncbi:MAG: ABC transporter permease [Planctomycetaceae bacterium]
MAQAKKTFTLGRLFSQYGSLLVLLLLCAYYSWATWGEQHPSHASAGRKLGSQAAEYLQKNNLPLRAIVIVRKVEADAPFADAATEAFVAGGGEVVGNWAIGPDGVHKNAQELAGSEPISAIITHDACAKWGSMEYERLQSHGHLANVVVLKPKSYYWPSFLTWSNLLNVLSQDAEVAIIAIGMTMVIITAGIDLSVGSLVALAGVLMAVMINGLGGQQVPIYIWGPCVLVAMLLCSGVGAMNGVLSTYGRIPAFIVTLATMMMFQGIAQIIAVRYQFAATGENIVPETIPISAQGFHWLGGGSTFGIPNPIWLMAILYSVAHIFMTRTPMGRYIYAVGGNPEASQLSGIPVKKVLILVYALCGTMVAIAGFLSASRFHGGRPGAGEQWELQVIAAVVVGGTSLSGGEGRILGTLVGVLIITVIHNGLNMAGVEPFEQKVVFGALILAASFLDQVKKRWAVA